MKGLNFLPYHYQWYALPNELISYKNSFTFKYLNPHVKTARWPPPAGSHGKDYCEDSLPHTA